MQIFKLKFHSALHVDSKGSGEPEVSDDFIRSDTLSAALCLSWAAIYQDVGKDFFLEPPFMVSSAFPYIDDIFLFPLPAWRIWTEINDEATRKSLKKIRWVSQGILNLVIAGKKVDHERVHVLPGGVALIQQEADSHPDLLGALSWAVEERQRVMVDRLGLSPEGGLFFFALQFFAPWAGMWFLANGKPDALKQLRAAIDYLGDTGIGADRNNGMGHFQVAEESTFSMPKMSADGYITLSLFNPGDKDKLENLTRKTAYGITTRSGWIVHSPLGRPPIRVFTEGSYFSAKPIGRVVKMLPKAIREQSALPLNHSAPRDFRAVYMPCVEPSGIKE